MVAKHRSNGDRATAAVIWLCIFVAAVPTWSAAQTTIWGRISQNIEELMRSSIWNSPPGCRRRRPYRARWCRNSRAGSHVSSCSNPTGTMSKSRTAARAAAASQFSTTTFVCTTKQSVLSLWREVFQQTARSDRSDLGLEVRRSRWYSASRRGERDRGDWLRWWLQWRWVGLLQCGWREHRPAI